jgi:radical SAM superfamily enzyme YgiQ (UPF0313 family)
MTMFDPRARSPLIADEIGTILRRAPVEVLLAYPNTYRVAGSSLGMQVIYRALNSRDHVACHRAVLPDDALEHPGQVHVHSLEFAKPLADYDAVCFSIAYELDLAHLVLMLEGSGIPALASERGPQHPPVVVGGPLTNSNVLPLGLFADVVVMGEADLAVYTLLDWLQERPDRAALTAQAAGMPGFWVPSIHGDAVPELLSVRGDAIPARGVWHSPQAEFRNMMLVETSRGCPRYCKFCVVRAPVAPVRSPELDQVVAVLDRPEFEAAPRVGFVGAAVSDWPFFKDILRAALERGKQVGVSSLRADKLDDELVDLLHQGGYRTLTVASDAASQRLRGKMMKGLRERHLMEAAEQARRVGMKLVKVYVIIGLPDENDDDIQELIDFGQRLSKRVRSAITLSPFVPKLHTPLAEAPFEPAAAQTKKLQRIQRGLGGRVDVRFDSPRQAWVEYRLSQGGIQTGHAVLQAARNGASLGAWKAAFAELDRRLPDEERSAVQAAQRHGLWTLTGAR